MRVGEILTARTWSIRVQLWPSVERLPSSIRLHFANAAGGLVVKGTKLEEFAIAGEDRKWYWADAHIEGDTVLSHPLGAES